jgi:hypothetical protein
MGSNDGGFNFDLCKRNAMLEGKGMHLPKAWKTGTTIAGVIYKVEMQLAVLQKLCYRRVDSIHAHSAVC